ncbi:MAG: hypothetical protein VKS61_15985 [Candidatus Sericytochromatia bacterium]|nr:hypothetical protein [Candidatus Sericytochromatia bacterium]
MATRQVPQAGTPITLTGVVRLLSETPGSVVSNAGARLISDAGGALVGDAGGSLLANNGAGVAARAWRLLQAPPQEAALAEAGVYLTDAAGAVIVDEAGQPLGAISDSRGRYIIRAVLPPGNAVLRVPLREGGALASILVRSDQPLREVPIDTAASLGSAYVLDQYVKGRQAVLDKLPEPEALQLRTALLAAVVALPSRPRYDGATLVEATARLRRTSPRVDEVLTTIRVLLLGQERLGEGRQALEVPLSDPSALVDDGAGGFLVTEERTGRLRRVAADGTLTTLMDSLQGRIKANVTACSDAFRTADGTVLLAGNQPQGHGIQRLSPDGTLTLVVGQGGRGRSEVGKPARETPACPESLWVDPDGTIWFGEDGKVPGGARVLTVGADGVVREPAAPLPNWLASRIVGLVRGSDNAMYALVAEEDDDHLARLAPGATSWTRLCKTPQVGVFGDLANAPDGDLWVTEDLGGRLTRVKLDGTRRVVMERKAGAPIVRPADLLPRPDGSLLMIDVGAGVVNRVTPAGTVEPVAGLDISRGFDPTRGVALNGPQGLALDATGRLLITEGGGHAVRIWDGTTLSKLMGNGLGRAAPSQPLDSATLNNPFGLVERQGRIFLVDRSNRVLRLIDPTAGDVRVVAGGFNVLPTTMAPGIALAPGETSFLDAFGLAGAASGPMFWSAAYRQQVVRVDETGTSRLLAGSGERGDAGDGGPAETALLDTPGGLALTPGGDLLVADLGNMRVRRVVAPGGPAPRIEAFAGLPRAQAVDRLVASYGGTEEGKPAAMAAMAAPAAVCLDAEGNVYVSELGTAYTFVLPNLPGDAPLIDVATLPVVPPRIRKIDREGRITTLVGPGGQALTDPTAPDALVLPTAMIVDAQGRLVVADVGANVVRFFSLR